MIYNYIRGLQFLRPFFILPMKYFSKKHLVLVLPILLIPIWGLGQNTQDPTKKVLDILTEKEAVKIELDKLKLGAWEALSYLEPRAAGNTSEDLLEAVPDYYNFSDSTVIIKLVNPNDYNDYGLQLELKFEIKGKQLILYDKKGKEKDRWSFLYLDKNYLAMDMGEIRVFFTKTPPQE